MQEPEGKPFEILLVEDNEDHAAAVQRSLRKHRVANRITHLKDGEEALNYLFRRGAYKDPDVSPRPWIVLLDLRLPKVDGMDVLREIKQSESLHRIPVVVLTSSDAEKDIAQASEYNANSYVVKPVDFDKFVQLMDDIGFYWLGYHKNPANY